MKRIGVLVLLLCAVMAFLAPVAAEAAIGTNTTIATLDSTTEGDATGAGAALKAYLTDSSVKVMAGSNAATTSTRLGEITAIDGSGATSSAKAALTGAAAALITQTNFPVLETLNLAGCTGITDITVAGPVLAGFTTVLKTVDLSGTGLAAAVDVSLVAALETLNLSNCTSLNAAVTTPASLLTLNMSGCSALDTDPVLTASTKMTTLDMSGCSKFSKALDLSNLVNLESVNLSDCAALNAAVTLPNGNTDATTAAAAGNANTKLKTLLLKGCALTGLTALPYHTSLPTLNISDCTEITAIDLTGLTSLTSVDASGATKLNTVTTDSNASLTELNLSKCVALNQIDLAGLTSLTALDASGASKLAKITTGSNTSLKDLNLSNCVALDQVGGSATVVSMSGLSSLEKLNLSGSGANTVTVLDLTGATALVSVDASESSIVTVTAGGIALPNLKTLDLSDSPRLLTIGATASAVNLTNLTGLEFLNLNMSNVTRTAAGPSSVTLTAAEKLISADLTGFKNTGNTAPTTITASDMDNLTTVILTGQTAVTTLEVTGSTKLKNLDVAPCTALKNMYAANCGLETLDLTKNAALTRLRVYNNALTALDLSKATVGVTADEFLVYGQKRTIAATSANLAVASLDMTALDARNIRNLKGDGADGTVDTTVGTLKFSSAPSVITYDYITNLDETQSMDVTVTVSAEDTLTLDPKSINVTDAVVGTAITAQTVTASKAVAWTFSGTLPADLSVASTDTTLTISGTPSEEGTFSGSITATASDDSTASATWTITVADETPRLVLTPNSTGDMTAKVGDAVRRSFTASVTPAATGVTFTWTTTPATAPAGLEYFKLDNDATLVVSGEPDEVTSGDISVEVTATGYDGVGTTFHYNFTANENGGGSSSGCDAGFGALAVAVLGLLGLKRK